MTQIVTDEMMRAQTARLEASLADLRHGINSCVDERNKLRDLVHRLGAIAVYVADRLEDQGGLVSLGSTNDADWLRKAKEEYDAYRFETGDMGKEDILAEMVK